MTYRIDPNLKTDLKKYGAKDWNECFHCGNCTAICPLTENNFLFPRKSIRQAQMGLKQKLSANLDPWLCYFCGECSTTCPRNANPGEIMMTLRRYLTSVYDWTGLSKRFYTSKVWEISFIVVFFVLIVAAFGIFLPPAADIFSNPSNYVDPNSGGVLINSLVPGLSNIQFVKVIETGDLIMAAIVATLLISNILRMFYFTIIKDKSVRVPFYAYFTEAWQLIFNFVSQPKFSKCDKKSYWLGHFLLMSGYTIMFIVIVGLLPRFQIEEVKPWYNWQRILGYYATFGLLFFIVYSIIGRIRKKEIKFKFSHETDWLFLIMLGLTTITGILIHFFRIGGLPGATYILYVIHLAVLVPMIIIEVPFSKWSHLAYRPFAVYFSKLKKAWYKKQNHLEVSVAA
ncbi:MAG: 4Fe-4S dicluster domain-containing protein [Sphingobacteriales bacterium]|nr:4Fe-4S dicluster domain-containing protein [Sphingobacteriales bacterium]